MAPVGTAAVLLRSHDYGDTSRILRFYTESHGLVSVMARGVRGRSGKGSTAIATFASGELTAYVKTHRDLHTMKDFACHRLRAGLGANMLRFAGASAVAELVLAHTDQEPHVELFQALEDALDGLETRPEAQLPRSVLSSLWRLTQTLGFAPQLDPCVLCESRLGADEVGRFDFAAGGVRCADCAHGAGGPRFGPMARAQLSGLLSGGSEPISHPRRHLAVLSEFITYHIASKPLKSMGFLDSQLPPDPESAD